MKKVVRTCISSFMTGSAFVALVVLAGCSFHSNQWAALKSVLEPEKVAMPGRWLLSGQEGNVVVYPVQQGRAIVFTDGQTLFFKFDGWHVVEIKGYGARYSEIGSRKAEIVRFDYRINGLPDEDISGTKIGDQRDRFSEAEGEIVYRVGCAAWQRVVVPNGELLSQSCAFEDGATFSNNILLDQSGNISSIESVTGPDGVRFQIAASG